MKRFYNLSRVTSLSLFLIIILEVQSIKVTSLQPSVQIKFGANQAPQVTFSGDPKPQNQSTLQGNHIEPSTISLKQSVIETLSNSIENLLNEIQGIKSKLEQEKSEQGHKYRIHFQEMKMPSKGKEAKIKHNIDTNQLYSVNVNIINRTSSMTIFRSQYELIDQKLLFSWYVDNDYFYLIHPLNTSNKDSLFVSGADVRITYILKNGEN